MVEVKYRILFYRNGEQEHFHSCLCWYKAETIQKGKAAAKGYIKDLFKLDDRISLEAEVVG